MKKTIAILILLLSFPLVVLAPPSLSSRSAQVMRIKDSGGFYTANQVEGALQEIGNGTTLDPLYLRLDATNTPSAAYSWTTDFTTTGQVTTGLLIPTSTGVTEFGSPADIWAVGFIAILEADEIRDTSGITALDVSSRNLFDTSGQLSVDFENRTLTNSTEATVINWANQQLLIAGDIILDWSTTGLADFGNSKIQTTGIGSFGNSSQSSATTFDGDSYPVARLTRTTAATNQLGTAFDFALKSTGNMVDGFGPGLTLSIGDDTQSAINNYIAAIYAARDGSDTSGKLLFKVNNGLNTALTLRSTQKAEFNGAVTTPLVMIGGRRNTATIQHMLEIYDNTDMGITWDSSTANPSMALLGADSYFELVSTDVGTWGSALTFKQVDGTVYENAWSIVRQTDGDGTGDGSLRFTYGTSTEAHINASKLILGTDATLQLLGDTFWVGAGTGLPYGEISVVSNAAETVIASQNVFVQVTIFDTNGVSNNSTPDHTNDHITITKAGVYLITCSVTLDSIGGAGSTAEMEVQKNNGNVRVGALHVDRTLSGGGAESSAETMTGMASLSVNDTIEVWIKNESNTQNYVVEDITLSVVQIGG